jgi:hypothetical protein
VCRAPSGVLEFSQPLESLVPRLTKYAVFATFVSLLSGCAVSAQSRQNTTPWAITVLVSSHTDNKVLPRIKVQLSESSGAVIDTYFTDSGGQAITTKVPPGQYVISIETEGYKHFRQDVEVLDYPGPRVNVSLEPLAAEKPAVPGDIVSARELGLPQMAQEAMQKGREALFQKHDPAASLAYFQKVLVMAPDFYEADYFLGIAYRQKGLAKEAEAAFHAAIDMSFNQFPAADFALAAVLSDNGRFSEAEAPARAGLALQPDSWQGNFELARALMGLNRLPEAEQRALAAKKLNPNISRLYLLLANIHLRLHNNEAVLDDVNTYMRIDPNGPYIDQARTLKEKTELAIKQ